MQQKTLKQQVQDLELKIEQMELIKN